MISNIVRKGFAPLIAILVLAISIAWMAGLFNDKIPANELVNAQSKIPVAAFEVTSTLVPKYEYAPASLKARETTLISSRILAKIEKITVRSGDSVAQGEPLVMLENKDLQSQLAQTQSKVESLQGELVDAQNTLKRVKNLKQKGLASKAELDQAQAVFTRFKGEIQTAQQGQQEAEAELAYSTILAPFAGRIVDRKAEPGNMAAPGEPILALYNPNSILIESDIRESIAINLKLGQKLSVYIDSLDLNLTAVISEMVPAADPNAHSFVVKANILHDERLRPGMFARIQIPTGEESIILIPKHLIESFGQLNKVWVNNQGRLTRRFIRIGESHDNMVEVVSGLTQGDKLVSYVN
ncbi:efflux RND transporter periplasmic adaptor subunit [Paraglaciecola sp. 2405UD69-4]|uniref:efflux RND transporter periplasmic adaptor subunit n=1 Tax=Paraglaciecola sp. 2405UD69-4 TaxID=3391836 RepID=UPI0039C9E260